MQTALENPANPADCKDFDWCEAIAILERKVAEREAKLRPAKILVVDDCENDTMLLLHKLENYSCETTTCDDAKTAIDLIEHGDFDLVLTDLRMPVLSGSDIVKAVARKSKKGAHIVLMTGMPVCPEVDDTLALGAVWAGKPITDQVLRMFLRLK